MMIVKDLEEFIYESYYRQIGFTKEGSYCFLSLKNV